MLYFIFTATNQPSCYQTGGFFIEVGALDGETFSNTLYFEKSLGWKGLLIEPNPESFAQLSSKNRKAYSIQAGLSLSRTSDNASFRLQV